MISAGV
ncbi:hypothetical protein YPPY12_4559, partial [Yersinia pestis PY-12]